ncbi:hypothetical protein [Flavobacterium sp. UMI-01]|nr:hypothetical protein [Flavobacterium sp. UMI-01]GIZ09058.1 hypothetical protein FUMI01_17850 [Flavobacterium sp. UMI-01]GIZ10012.1 hypothetical protein FUMI01_27380 [Flavobacterium sp. UMI-01]GIZ10254.1 hypothetical protein FUMI01_29780 [Flavobacterium sp. UMI-01]
MKKTDIEARITELETALKETPNHPNRIEIETDIRNLQTRLEYQDYD